MAIGNKRYIHFNAQKRETIRQNIGRGTFTILSPTKFLEGGHVPRPHPASAPIFVATNLRHADAERQGRMGMRYGSIPVVKVTLRNREGLS